MKMTIDAPWTDGPQTYDGILGFIGHVREQLLFFQKKKDTEYIRKDIEAYDLILKEGNEDNARLFLDTKRKGRITENSFDNNMEVINHLKKTNQWK